MNLRTHQKGFTIVELLIVIVVIAILAAISIVAYTGIQNRAYTSAGQSLASQVEKKAQAYYTIQGTYPLNQTAFGSGPDEAKLEGNVGTFIGDETITATQADKGKAIAYLACNGANTTTDQDDVTGAIISYWDFSLDTPIAKHRTVGTASCSTT